MAGTGQFRDAAALLDAGPLSKRVHKPPLELLKLRFGLSSAQRDADGEIATAKRILKARPKAPDGTDLLSPGLLRSGRSEEHTSELQSQ